jgi:hypothetical protein
MGDIIKISRYYLTNPYRLYFILVAGALLLHLAASMAVDTFVGPERDAGAVGFFVLCAGCIIGAATFAPSFRYLLSQGISRKKFFVATGVSTAAMSVICAIMVMIYFGITLHAVQTTGFIVIYEGMYHDTNLFKMVVWESAALFFLGMLGWLISLVYYRLGTIARMAVFGGLVGLWILLASLNNITDGSILRHLVEFLKTVLGFDSAVANPFIAVLSFVTFGLILFGCNFLLIRRAQITN